MLLSISGRAVPNQNARRTQNERNENIPKIYNTIIEVINKLLWQRFFILSFQTANGTSAINVARIVTHKSRFV